MNRDDRPERPTGARGRLIWHDASPPPRQDDATVPLPRPSTHEIDDPWSHAERPLARPEPVRRLRPPGGPPGCVLAAVALLLIGAIAGLVAWPLAVRPFLRDAARDGLRDGIAAEIAEVGALPTPPTGELVLTEADLNAHLRANADDYAPLGKPQVAITADGLRLSFSLYGTDNAYTARPAVRDGRLVVLDGDLDGAAARVLGAEDAAALVEEQLAALLARSGLRPTAVRLRDGALTIATAPAA